MKLQILFTSIAVLFFSIADSQVRPTKMKVVAVNPEIKEFYEEAIVASSKARSTTAEMKNKARLTRNEEEKARVTFSNIVLKRGFKLAGEVKKTKGRISADQYASFKRQLEEVEADMNKIEGGGTTAAGDPKPGTMGECFKSCDDYGGGGFGGGKGWKRFTCKAACIIVKLPPGN